MAREPMIPLSAFVEFLKQEGERRRDHEARIIDLMDNHLEKVAALYEKALNPPPLAGPSQTMRMYMNEEEEDAQWAMEHGIDVPPELKQALVDANLGESEIEFN